MKYTVKLIFLIILSSTISIRILSQTQVLISPDSVFRYFVGTTEPDTNWLLPDFDDSSWPADTGLIGYGYGFEDVPIDENASSLFIRMKFNIDDPSQFNEANFFADYDDGYIAYLNGKEIVRVNVDKSIDRPLYNDTAVRSHQMQVYDWDTRYPVLGYHLNSTMLDSCLVSGENVIAVHVLNDSLTGSDLQFLLVYFDITYSNYNYFNWDSRYKAQVDLDSTEFPLVIIETDEFGLPYKNTRQKAFMGIIDNGKGNYNHPTDSFNVYSGDVSIEVRGQSSSEFPKRSYRFELIDSMAIDSNVSLLGMPKDNDWILLGPFHDKALFRNPMVFDMGRKMNDQYQPRNEFCEVIINGEFLGVYSLLESIKRDNNRVDIAKLREEEISGIDLTGGYIIRYDKPCCDLQIVYPKEDKIQPAQEEYIYGFIGEYNKVLSSQDFTDPQIGFRKYINDTSLIDYLIVSEITKNADSYLYSTYMYKDRDDRDPRLHYGPLWDMNLAFGNSYFQQGHRTDGWQFDNGTNLRLRVIKLFQDEILVDLFQERWHAARAGCFHTDSLFAYIDSMATYLQPAIERNYEVWPIIDKDLFFPNYQSMTYDEEILNIKNWLLGRLDWIDSNIDNIYYAMPEPPIEGFDELTEWSYTYNVYPNPFSEALVLNLTVSESVDMKIEIFDALGTLKYIETERISAGNMQKVIEGEQLQSLSSGVYLLRLSMNDNLTGIQRLIKR